MTLGEQFVRSKEYRRAFREITGEEPHMSTRSVLAVPYHGSWRGRYCHSDGYPSGVGVELQRIYREVFSGDLELMKKYLTLKVYGWSYLTPDAHLKPGYNDDGRFQEVPHIGIGYTTKNDQSREDEWILADGDNCGTEWAYLMLPEGIRVLKLNWEAKPHRWEEKGLVHWDDTETMEDLDDE